MPSAAHSAGSGSQRSFICLRDLLPAVVPAPGIAPVLFGFLTGLITLAGFALPPVLRLKQVPPLRVLRRELVPLPPAALAVYGGAAVTAFLLMWRYTGNITLTLAVLAAV